MLNRQLKSNINILDVEIGKLTKELEGLKHDNRYEVKVKKIEDLTNIRDTLTRNKDASQIVIDELDRQILELAKELADIELDNAYLSKVKQLDELTKVRSQLSEDKTNESNAPTIISGLISIGSILLILKYEETDVITSKAFSMATKMFRGK